MNEKTIIFDLTQDHDYRGVLFAEGDNEAISKEFNCPPIPHDFLVGIMAIIWKEKNGYWFLKGRLKFPSGNKSTFIIDGGKDCNETKLLQLSYKYPMKNKIWTPNPSGKANDLIEIIEKLDMIESLTYHPLKGGSDAS